MSQLVNAPSSIFDLAYYECNGWQRQSLTAGLEWDVEIDKANRRYRVKGRAKLTRSWSGKTQFTVRERQVRVGTTTQNFPDYSMPFNNGQTVFDMSDWVYSEWFAYNDEGKATVTSVPVGYRCCFNHYTRAAGGTCYDARYDCYGSNHIADVNPAPIANQGGPGPAYTPVGQVYIDCKQTGTRSGTATSTVDYGIGKPGMNKMTMSGAISGSTSSTTLTATSSSLQPNSRNVVNVTATNGISTSSALCEFVTLCENTISNCRSKKSDEIQIDVTIAGGYGVYPPTTVVKYRKASGGTWQEFFTTKTKTKTIATASALQRDTAYEFQACTQTPVGTYCGNIIACKTTPGAYAIIDSADPYIQEFPDNNPPPNVRAKLCYSWKADCAPVDLQVFYRVKNGLDDKWWWTDVFTTDKVEGSNCVTLVDLIQGATYEAVVKATGCDGVTWESPEYEFTTPPLKSNQQIVCENLTYMKDLICQAVEAIKHGYKTIYANSASQEKCDPYSENPTLATLWSRFLRWGAGSACLMCEMIDFVVKSGKKNQYFAGEIGWVNILEELEDEYDDDSDDGKLLATSDAIRKLIDEKLHEVWHFHGSVDYMVDDIDHIPDGAKTVLSLADSKVYELVDGKWVLSTTILQPDDFAVYHFNYENKVEHYGTIKPESAWYYWEGTWNNLDVNIEWMVKVVEEMFSHIDEFTYTEKCTPRLHVRTDDVRTFDCANLLSDPNRQLDFLLEPFVIAPPGYHLITFETGADATIIQDQEVLDGALAQRPTDPEKYCMDFVEWQDVDNLGTPFDWSTIILKDYDLRAIWTPHPVTITFDLGSDKATGAVPTDINGFCGDKIGTLPTDAGFSRPGGTFSHWEIDGVEIDSAYIMEEDKTAVAVWTMQKFNVTFHPENGDPNTTVVAEYEESAEAPADPTYTDHIFQGWFTDTAFTSPFDETAPVYGDIDVYAKWINQYYTVTFNTDGGTPVAAQTVEYEDYATKPADPTKDGYIIREWQLDGNPYLFDVPVTEDITLVAVWDKVWTVTFDADGGTPAPDVQLVRDGETVNVPKAPEKDGCEFNGWYEDGETPEPCPEPPKPIETPEDVQKDTGVTGVLVTPPKVSSASCGFNLCSGVWNIKLTVEAGSVWNGYYHPNTSGNYDGKEYAGVIHSSSSYDMPTTPNTNLNFLAYKVDGTDVDITLNAGNDEGCYSVEGEVGENWFAYEGRVSHTIKTDRPYLSFNFAHNNGGKIEIKMVIPAAYSSTGSAQTVEIFNYTVKQVIEGEV